MAFHNTAAAQMAHCRAECEDHPGNNCYLGFDDVGCVIGEPLLPWEGLPQGSTQAQCCMVSSDMIFIQTVQDILGLADQLQDVGTMRARTALNSLLNTNDFHIPPVFSQFVTRNLKILRSHIDTRDKDLLNLLDRIVPHSRYWVSCGLAHVLEQPESRRRKQNITYKIRQSNWHESHLPNDVLTVATNLHVTIDEIDCARLDVYLQNLLEVRQPRPRGEIRLNITNTFETKIRQREIDRIRGYIGSTQFTGSIVVQFTVNNLANDVVCRSYDFPPSEHLDRLLKVDPLSFFIFIT